MNVAILISGQMRTAERCIDSIKQHVYAALPLTSIPKTDLCRQDYATYAATAADEDAHKIELFPRVLGMTEPQPELPEKNYAASLGLGCYGVQVVLKQLWALRRAWQIMEGDGYRPDWVIRLRPDCYFHNDIENLADCDPNAVYVPTFHNFYGLNDRFAFGGYEAMRVYCNRLDNMDEYVEAGGIFQPESHLLSTLRQANISVRRTRVLFDLVRKGGKHVKPEWNKDADYGDVTEVLP